MRVLNMNKMLGRKEIMMGLIMIKWCRR